MIWLPVVGNYADVDVYASVLAYADLLNQRGKTAKVYIPSKPNYSVPEELRLPEQENATFDFRLGDQAIILDLSEPDVIHKLISNDQILELIDHHPGYEEYWQNEIGERAVIEKIGAVATSIFEWWGECWDYTKMSPEIAKLLLAAILDNTINFNAEITTERDRVAAAKLAEIAGVDFDEFVKWYFSEVSRTILNDLENSLLQDSKGIEIKLSSGSVKLAFSQLLLWDAQDVLSQSSRITEIMNHKYKNWIVSVLCISERKNYILASSKVVGDYFAKLLDLEEQGSWLVTGGGRIFAQGDHCFASKEPIDKKAVVIAGAVIENDGRYLLVQEANEKCRGKWNLPAGHLDPGETIIEAAKREAKEETGCEIEPVNICQIGNRVLDDGVFMSVIFEAKLLHEEIVFDKSEILDVKWFSYEEILAMREQIRNEVLMLGAIDNIRNRKVASLEIINLY